MLVLDICFIVFIFYYFMFIFSEYFVIVYFNYFKIDRVWVNYNDGGNENVIK